MNVRPAESGDAPSIEAVARAAWWETYPGLIDPDTVEETLAELYDAEFLEEVLDERGDLLFLVVEDDEAVVGFASAQQTWADEVEIHTVYVDPDRWEEGFGTALLDGIESSAREAGVDRLRTSVVSGNSIGRAFFESRGFERVETVNAEIGDETVPEDVFERTL